MSYTSIRILVLSKVRLDKLKGRDTYIEWMEKAVTYFEVTGLRPDDMKTHPSQAILTSMSHGFERIIKIVRSIEKDKINTILENSSVLISGKLAENKIDGAISAENAEVLLASNKGYKIALEKQREKVADVRKLLNKMVLTDNISQGLREQVFKILNQF
jgi:hypothetical protein